MNFEKKASVNIAVNTSGDGKRAVIFAGLMQVATVSPDEHGVFHIRDMHAVEEGATKLGFATQYDAVKWACSLLTDEQAA